MTGVGLLVGGASLGAALIGSLTALASVAGGALVSAAIMSSVSGKWGAEFWQNFEISFTLGAAALAVGSFASLFSGGLSTAGGNGIQGFVQTKNSVLADRSFTLGFGSVWNGGAGAASHEFGHTIFALGASAAGSSIAAGILYGASALPGIITPDSAYGSGGFEHLFDFLGGIY